MIALLTLFLLGIGLSFDTFAVSISCGLTDEKISFWQAARIAIFFAFFQATMPLLGYFLGSKVRNLIEPVDHWVAFTLLSLIGLKMIWESFKADAEKFNPHDVKVILTMSLATTVDAFIVGITFAFTQINLLQATIIIGMVTFLAAMLGMLFGKKIGSKLGKKAEILGGVILIVIGLKILTEHLNLF